MSFEFVRGVIQSCFGCGNAAVDDDAGIHLSEAHEDEVQKADGSSGGAGLNPEAEEVDEDEKDEEQNENADDAKNERE